MLVLLFGIIGTALAAFIKEVLDILATVKFLTLNLENFVVYGLSSWELITAQEGIFFMLMIIFLFITYRLRGTNIGKIVMQFLTDFWPVLLAIFLCLMFTV